MPKKSFILYLDYQEHFDLLTDADRGKLISAIFRYVSSGDIPEFDGMPKMAFSFVRSALDRDAEKYQCEIEKRREAGRLGGEARARNAKHSIANQASASDAKHSIANQGDSVNVNDNVNDNDTESDVKNKDPHTPKGGLVLDCETKAPKTYSKEFEAFWQEYPKKVGKDAAWKSWQKRKDKPDCIEILNAVYEQKNSVDWKKDGGQFIPNPATWINQGRWMDDVRRYEPTRQIFN